MNNQLVTVVVPVYNVERYLDRCIESIVNQTYKNLEILLIDDGSPDKCPQMCDSWAKKDGRIRVVHKQNEGQGVARNVGIEQAAGEFICFFDSDDYIADDLIEKAYKKICQEQAEIVVYGNISAYPEERVLIPRIPDSAKEVYEGTEVLCNFLPQLIGPDPKTGRDFHLPAAAWAALYRTDLIRRANWRFVSEREIISEDLFSHLMLYQHVRKVAVLKEALYFYCHYPSSFSRAYRPDRFEKIRYFYDRCVEYCRDAGYPDAVTRRCMEPFVTYTVEALKQEASFAEKPLERIRLIVNDPVLQRVVQAKKKDKTTLKKQVLLWAIRNKQYLVVKLLLDVKNIQNKSSVM